jgi:transcriptional regulator with XRE-family HTH domain
MGITQNTAPTPRKAAKAPIESPAPLRPAVRSPRAKKNNEAAKAPVSPKKAPRQPKAKKTSEAVADMIENAQFLGAIRQALDQTQLDVARGLGVGQGAVAQLERRSDVLVSTLARYVSAMGATLHVSVTTPDGALIPLAGFSALRGSPAAGKKRGRPSGHKPVAALAAKAAKAAAGS